MLQTGFVAEEVAAIDPLFAVYQDGIVESVKYDKITVLLAAGFKQLDVQVQANDARLAVVEAGDFSGNLHVAGYAEITGNLVVLGDTTLAKLIVTGDTEVQQLTVNGKIITAGATPTIVLGAQATGQGAVTAIAGNDTVGNISYTAGTQILPSNPLVSGAQISVTYTAPFDQAPRIALTAKDSGSAAMRYYVETTLGGFIVHFIDIPVAGATYTFDYIVIQ